MENSYKYFCNKDCKYYPCHDVKGKDGFNCLFCYCPLYSMGDGCGGDHYLLEDGTKVCTNCTFPHIPENYEIIMNKLKEARKNKL